MVNSVTKAYMGNIYLRNITGRSAELSLQGEGKWVAILHQVTNLHVPYRQETDKLTTICSQNTENHINRYLVNSTKVTQGIIPAQVPVCSLLMYEKRSNHRSAFLMNHIHPLLLHISVVH
jgi:hypothetical protein